MEMRRKGRLGYRKGRIERRKGSVGLRLRGRLVEGGEEKEG